MSQFKKKCSNYCVFVCAFVLVSPPQPQPPPPPPAPRAIPRSTRQLFPLPALADRAGRIIVDKALNGSFCTIRFTSANNILTVGEYVDSIWNNLEDAINQLTAVEHYALKVCFDLCVNVSHQQSNNNNDDTDEQQVVISNEFDIF